MLQRRIATIVVVVGLGAVVAACTPVAAPPPPPPPADALLCPATDPPGPEDHVAFVEDDATGEPEIHTFEAKTQAEVEQNVAELEQAEGDVVAVERDGRVSAAVVDPANDPQYANQYGFTTTAAGMDFETAWNTNAVDGTNVRVAVVDTGVQGNHPDLDANVVLGKDYVEDSGTASHDATIDGNGHGTHVAGTIAAEDNAEGVVGGAPHATIVPIRVLDCGGSGDYSDVAAGILWAADQDPGMGQAKVINLSLGGPSPSQVIRDAIAVALAANVVVVAAAGNCGPGQGCTPVNRASYPAAYPEVLAVGATDSAGAKAPYSNNNDYVDIAAPGSAIVSTMPTGYGTKSGTSMATPHVSALVVLLLDCDGALTPSQVIARIVATGNPVIPGFATGTVELAQAGAATVSPCV